MVLPDVRGAAAEGALEPLGERGLPGRGVTSDDDQLRRCILHTGKLAAVFDAIPQLMFNALIGMRVRLSLVN
jgi:hypothetical protein